MLSVIQLRIPSALFKRDALLYPDSRLSPLRPQPLRRAGLCRRTTLRQAPCNSSVGCSPLLQSNPPKVSCLHPRAVRGCRQETFAYTGWSNRPCPGHGQTIRRGLQQSASRWETRTSRSSLGPLEGCGGQERTCVATFAKGPAASGTTACGMTACRWPACRVHRGAVAVEVATAHFTGTRTAGQQDETHLLEMALTSPRLSP